VSVTAIQKNSNRITDVTDHPDNNVSARNQTPSPPAALRSLMTSMIADPDEPMHEANYEFSDPEIDLIEEPVAVVPRTRSQSRANDVPAPPPEPVKKQTRVKRAKKIDPDYDPRPRRRIREADSIEYGDE
jgi:hypothetical protein